MQKIRIVEMHVVYGLFIDYTTENGSDYLIHGDISDNEESVNNLISLLKKYNDFDSDSLRDIIEDFVCAQGLPDRYERGGKKDDSA